MKALLLPPSSSSSSGFHPDTFASQQQQPGAGTGPRAVGCCPGSWQAAAGEQSSGVFVIIWQRGPSDTGGVIHPEQGRKLVFLPCRIHLKNPEAAYALQQNSASPFLKLYRIQ